MAEGFASRDANPFSMPFDSLPLDERITA